MNNNDLIKNLKIGFMGTPIFAAPILERLIADNYYIDYVSLGYKLFTAQGTTSTFVSLLINFGLIGAIVFLFCISYFMAWLRKQNTQPYITMYVMTCGWLGISFFRIFETTMIKYIFQFSILIPLIIAIITNKLYKWLER